MQSFMPRSDKNAQMPPFLDKEKIWHSYLMTRNIVTNSDKVIC